MWKPQKTLVLHNSRETLARLLYRRIRHLCTTYKMQNGYIFYPKYAMYVWFPVCRTRWSKMIGYDNLICNVVWCYGYCLQASLLTLSLLKSLFSLFSFSFCMAKMRNAQTKIAIVYMQEQSCDTRLSSHILNCYLGSWSFAWEKSSKEKEPNKLLSKKGKISKELISKNHSIILH